MASAYRQDRLPPDRMYEQEIEESPALGHKGRGPLSAWLVASCWPQGSSTSCCHGAATPLQPAPTSWSWVWGCNSSGHRILLGTPGRHLPQPHSLQKELPPSLCTLHKAGRLLDLVAITCSSDRLAKVGSDPQIVPKSWDLWATPVTFSSA